MCKRKIDCLYLSIALIGIAILMIPSGGPIYVYAQESTPLADYGTCIKCHEDLYFLHDTGKWFCIRESPMGCVDCHGGDPYAINQEEAHASRKAHPILNEDASKCQECHPAECDERVAKFDRIAGISSVLLAIPFQQTPIIRSEQPLGMTVTEPVETPVWISAIEIVVPLLITGLAFAVYFVHKRRHTPTRKRRN
jgi:hypothetical protein